MKVHVYLGGDGWYWRLKAGNGEIISDQPRATGTRATA
jgi:uncharacterized protein YegP (UPF0339 family)